MIELLDSTLREGEQTPHVLFTTEQKIEIAKLLDRIGVEFIEAGHPIVSTKIEKDVKAICKLGLKAKIIGHARATREDIDKVSECGCEWVGIFMGLNELSLKHKYHMTKQEAEIKFLDALQYAKKKKMKIRCSIEDGSRTNIKDWLAFANKAQEIGIERFSVIDTVGIMTPSKMIAFVEEIKKEIKTNLNVHCHNDFGLAVANSLAAYEAGITCIDVTVNGLGERAGIASLSTIATALNVLYGVKKWDLKLLSEVSHLVEKYSHTKIPARQPIIGKNVFTHKAGLHSTAVLENPDVYELLHPEMVGAERKIMLGAFTSKKILEEYIRKVNKDISEEEVIALYNKIKKYKKEGHPHV